MKFTFIYLVVILSLTFNASFQNQSLGCATYDQTSGACTACKGNVADNNRINDNTNPLYCDCKSGYTEQPKESAPNEVEDNCTIDCATQCGTCLFGTKEASLCETCRDDTMWLPDCLYEIEGHYKIADSTTTITNENGSTQDLQTFVYKQCAKKCKYCLDSADNCVAASEVGLPGADTTKCNGQNRDEAAECECARGYYDNHGQLKDCEQCPSTCVTCNAYNECTACIEGSNRKINHFNGKCECEAGFRQFTEGGNCEKCYMLSDVCVKACPESTVANDELQICETLEFEMVSNATLILILGILIGIIQISLCCFVYVCLQRKHDVMERELFEEQMKIKQQRDYIYKNLENYNGSSDVYSKSQTGSPFKSNNRSNQRSGANIDESQMSHSNLQSSQIQLFGRGGDNSAVDQSNLDQSQAMGSQMQESNIDDGRSGSMGSRQQRRRRRNN